MPLNEVYDPVVWEDYLARSIKIFPFIVDEIQEKIIQMHVCHLLEIKLAFFDFDQSITSIGNVHLDWMPQSQIYHIVVVWEN